jgi:type VI secretion system protein ImpC
LDSILRLACLPGDSEQTEESISFSRTTSSKNNSLELVEQAFQSILLSILAHPEIHRLESVWRGIRLLLQNVSGNTVQVSVLSSSLEEIALHLDQIADFPENLFDLVLVDALVAADSAQLQRLQHWAMASQRLMAPLLVGGKASLLGFDQLSELGKSNSQFTNSSEPRAILTRNTCTSETMRWVGCVLNRVVARLPYNSSTARIPNMPFSEPDQHTVYANGVYVLAALVARSFSEGHPFQFSGQQFGILNDLKIHLIADRGGQVAIPTEELVSLNSQNMAARAGFILLGAIPNRDRAVIAQVRMMYRGSSQAMGTPEATQSLANQLAIAQMAKTIETVADAIPTGTEHQIVQGIFSIAIADIFQQAFPKTPETIVRTVPNSEYLEVIVKPHGEPVIDIQEIAFRTKIFAC